VIASTTRPDYVTTRQPRYELRARTTVHAPVGEVFEFFSRPENLGTITPSNMGFVITGISGPMGEGTLISYRLRIGGVPLKWKTRIDAWEPGRRFVDAQVTGPYACWWHEHRFEMDETARTIMEDRILYAPPFGIFGRLANHLFIRDALREIFAFRADAISLRFGPARTIEDRGRAS
jgi:ligand-binding SRPBCC domain-containing protein